MSLETWKGIWKKLASECPLVVKCLCRGYISYICMDLPRQSCWCKAYHFWHLYQPSSDVIPFLEHRVSDTFWLTDSKASSLALTSSQCFKVCLNSQGFICARDLELTEPAPHLFIVARHVTLLRSPYSGAASGLLEPYPNFGKNNTLYTCSLEKKILKSVAGSTRSVILCTLCTYEKTVKIWGLVFIPTVVQNVYRPIK